jgi:hypothetical protein
MEPRLNVEKKPQAYPEAPLARPESRLRSRFSIEPLEERIAPDKDKYGSGIGGSAGGSGSSYGL